MPERNPFEETRQAAQDWSPREQYISRSNQDRAYDATVNRFIQESQGDQQRWEQGGGRGAYPVFNEPGGSYNAPVSPGWLEASAPIIDNTGVMAAMDNNQQRNWLNKNPWLLNLLAKRHGGPETSKYLEGMGLGSSGFSAFGGNWTPSFERDDDGWSAGITGKWNLQNLFGEN